ncbi:unnamed protein product [Phyllotreta striolata]|uniref:LisH domain-containing protein n=1 Tax=Phyllotreta striolata TaxID=444603 RepID=A0A9N9TWC5_PHYSR|nr:unnamed protein product [Phyllotreta striolata]
MSENNTNTSTASSLIKKWEEEHSQPNYDPVPTLTKLAEIVEIETENYIKMDPDPFDERHPSRTDPQCVLGQVLKAIFKKDNFTSKLINDYLRDTFYSRNNIIRDIDQLNIAACRLMLDIMPGLDTTVVFQPESDNLILRLVKWVTNSIEPLQSYATGLLGAAMEIPEIAARFREQNSKLVPLLLQRLRRLKNSSEFVTNTSINTSRPFAHLSVLKSPPYRSEGLLKSPPPSFQSKKSKENGVVTPAENLVNESPSTTSPLSQENDRKRKKSEGTPNSRHEFVETPEKRLRLDENVLSEPVYLGSPQKTNNLFTEHSNSSWAELENFMIGTVQIFPPTIATRQILILRYLTAMGDHQEFLSHVFEHDALELILCYVNVRQTKEARLAFEALKYLSALLCHKKFSIEFIQCKGLEVLLEIPRPSIAATGVSMCFYYLGYCEEAMERVCLLPKYIVSSLVKYALWLLECAHDSGRCQSIMFFSLTFQFKVILEEFDCQDGLRKLHNVISTLPILFPDWDTLQMNEEQEGAYRQIVRHVCVAFRRYLEAHLYLKVEALRRSQMRPNEKPAVPVPVLPSYKACKSSPEEIQQQIEMLFQNMPYRSHWAPIDQLLKLGAVTLLLKIIAFAYEWNYSGRAETVRSALDVLAISCVMPKVQSLFCERVDLPEETLTVGPFQGINIILGAAEGEIVADADVQKAALRVIGNCVCAPIHRVGGLLGRFSTCNTTNSPNKKLKYKSSEDLIQKVWDSVRANSGIMVLLQLMQIKTPITDADCIRTLACKALAGLARSDTARQIISKLPLFTSGQLQNLMRDPILQEKRQEHVLFQKYALELLVLLSGKGKHTDTNIEASLANIHKANVVAQTKIQFYDKQLLQLIHHHLVQKGFAETAGMLVKEANLANAITSLGTQHPTKFRYSSTLTPSRGVRLSFSSPRTLPSASAAETAPNTSTVICQTPPSSTIKIIKKPLPLLPTTPTHNSRLQKQINGEPHIWSAVQEDCSAPSEPPRVTLDSIITEYLTNQHALCKNPMAMCPQFNLFVPHKCPDPKPRVLTANNFAMRSVRQQIGSHSRTMDRKFVHSRFCPVQTIRSTTDEGFFTCAKFMPGDKTLAVGDYNGGIHLIDLHKGNEINMFTAHDHYIVHLELNRPGNLMLTSCTWGKPISALWDMKTFEMKLPFDYEHVEFSKVTQEKIIGTRGEVATIFDINTGQSIMELIPRTTNQYSKNRATFSYNDELVLSDGVIYDVASGKAMHKLDKLNQTQSGVFHPNGLEIISNTEVWDIRTFHLLRTVPVLNQCSVVFSPVNTAIYAFSLEQEMDDGDSTFDTSFKTVDANDYSSISTFDVKKSIYDLSCNRYDTQIAIVENQGMYNSIQESVLRVYDVGRQRDDEDEQEEEDDEEDDMDGDGSDDDNSDGDDGDNDNNDNNENNGDDNDDNDDDIESDSESWTSLSTDSLDRLLFEF